MPSLFQLSMPDDVMNSKGEPTNATFLTSIIFQIAPWVLTLAHTKCVELPSHQRGFCLQQMDTKIHNWSKCREKSTMGFPSPTDMPTMHLSLGHPETEGRKAVRARRPWRMLWDNVFYLWPGNWTNKTSTMWLPKQGLHNGIHLTCQHWWGKNISHGPNPMKSYRHWMAAKRWGQSSLATSSPQVTQSQVSSPKHIYIGA